MERGQKYTQIIEAGWMYLRVIKEIDIKQKYFLTEINKRYKQKIHASTFSNIKNGNIDNIDQAIKIANCIKLYLYDSYNALYDLERKQFTVVGNLSSTDSRIAMKEIFQIKAIYEIKHNQIEKNDSLNFVDYQQNFSISESENKEVNQKEISQKMGLVGWVARKRKNIEMIEQTELPIPISISSHSRHRNGYVDHIIRQENEEVQEFEVVPYLMRLLASRLKQHKYYAILADSGMGKTTLLYQLWRKCYRDFSFRNKQVYLIPMINYNGIVDSLDIVKSIKNKERTILFLDAFDEDGKAIDNTTERLNEVIFYTREFEFVLISSRTQFFDRREDEPGKTSLHRPGTGPKKHSFQKLYIQPFTEHMVDKLLGKIHTSQTSRSSHKQLLIHLRDLQTRPLLIVETKGLENKKFGYLYEIYEAVIRKWIRLEGDLSEQDFMDVSCKIARYMYSKKQYWITNEGIDFFSKQMDKDIADVQNPKHSIQSHTLLTRGYDDLYRFNHRSFMEYLLAIDTYNEYEPSIGLYSFTKDVSDAQIFYKELFFSKSIKPFFEQIEGYYETKGGIRKGVASMTLDDVESIKVLDIRNIDSLEKAALFDKFLLFSNLKYLSIESCILLKIDSIQYLQSLEELQINYNKLENLCLKKLRKCAGLQVLQIVGSGLKKLEDIASAPNIWYLDIRNNPIKDISPLCKMQELSTLHISGNILHDWDSILGVEKLKSLTIYSEKEFVVPNYVYTELEMRFGSITIK